MPEALERTTQLQLMQQQQYLLTGGPVMTPAVAITAAGEASPVLENVELPAADDAETPDPVTAASPAVDSGQYESLLLEVVSEPDLRSPAEAGAYFRQMHSLVRYLKICDGNLAEGKMLPLFPL